MKRRTIRKIAVIAVALVVGYPLYQYWSAQKEYENTKYFFYNLSQVIESVGEENKIEKGSAYQEEVAEWNQEAEKAFNRFFSNYRRSEDSYLNKSMDVVKTLVDDVYELRNETVPLVELLFSPRMLDPRTVEDDAEYEWRMQTLNQITDYGIKYNKRLLKICEDFRNTVVGSDLPEKYRVYIWDDWADHIHDYIVKMGPQIEVFDSMADNYKRLFHFLHENKNYYYVDEGGKILFNDKRHAEQYQRLLYSAGITWMPS